jgi:hypothetical protein
VYIDALKPLRVSDPRSREVPTDSSYLDGWPAPSAPATRPTCVGTFFTEIKIKIKGALGYNGAMDSKTDHPRSELRG